MGNEKGPPGLGVGQEHGEGHNSNHRDTVAAKGQGLIRAHPTCPPSQTIKPTEGSSSVCLGEGHESVWGACPSHSAEERLKLRVKQTPKKPHHQIGPHPKKTR